MGSKGNNSHGLSETVVFRKCGWGALLQGRAFLTSAYLLVTAWQHPPVAIIKIHDAV